MRPHTFQPLHTILTLTAVTAVLACTLSQPVQAQQRDSINVDFYQGPVVSSNRVIGLGGAYIGIAEGADGHLVNPASFAVRYPYYADDWYDWDVAFSFLRFVPRDDTSIDLSNREATYDEAQFAQAGFNLKFGRHGVGLHIQEQTFNLKPSAEAKNLQYVQRQGGLGYAYAFMGGDLVLGLLANGGFAELKQNDNVLLGIEGSGAIFGALWAPCGRPWRLGAVLRTEVLASKVNGSDVELQGDLVPHQLSIPSEVGVGASMMFGQRPYNICPTFGDWEDDPSIPKPHRIRPRRYVLVAADLVVTGPTKDATGVQAFLDGDFQASGEEASFSARFGIESEVWANLLVVRGGTYYEPSRFKANAGRAHLTLGADLFALSWIWDWKLSAALDTARDYTNFGLGLGFWH